MPRQTLKSPYDSIKIAVYGSLKKGRYNYERFSEYYPIKFVGEDILHGYKLYDLGDYPGAIEGDGPLYVHILEVDSDCFRQLDRMEKFAGYIQKEVATSHGCAILWLYNEGIMGCQQITSGNY
jgi:gamma-glutamylcyclotransferase (GGCT)/AIG2-like uncharacterized protein YtfP